MNTKMRTVILNERGQIVIPEEMRNDLDLQPGEALILLEIGKEILLKKEQSVIKELGERKFWQALTNQALEKAWGDEDEAWQEYGPK